MLWTDLKTMREFFRLDSLNKKFYEVLVDFLDGSADLTPSPEKVFNEAYYQLTRMLYENPWPEDLYKYSEDIKASLGLFYSSKLVLTMAYFLYKLRGTKPVVGNASERYSQPLREPFLEAVKKNAMDSRYWAAFRSLYDQLASEKSFLTYRFLPRPISMDKMSGTSYNRGDVARNYDRLCIEMVIGLWGDLCDRRQLASMLYLVVHSNASGYRECYDELLGFLGGYTLEPSDEATQAPPPADTASDATDTLRQQIARLEKDKALLQAENAKLKAQPVESQGSGAASCLGLAEVVDYCKDRPDWADARPIVAMLRDLLPELTKEERKQVASIEKEFRNRLHGTTNNFSGSVGTVVESADNVNINHK